MVVSIRPAGASPYDTLSLTLAETDSLFLKENLLLLAQQYSINAREALVIQAKAYPNPTFSMQLNAIDPEHNRYFNVGEEGQKEFNLEQVFLLGGKRKSMITIARQDKALAEMELAELLRNLRLSLHSSFYLLGRHKAILDSYRQQLEVLDLLIAAYEEQAKKGNLPVKDVIRLKSVRLRITNNQLEETENYIEQVKIMQTLLHRTSHPLPQIDDLAFNRFQEQRTLDELLDLALQFRPDLEIARLGLARAGAILQLQKQMAIPDVAVNSGYDQRGGAFRNQVQVGLAVPLPLWNRNKGHIKAAGFEKQAASFFMDQRQLTIQSEVAGALEQLKACVIEYKKASQMYTGDFYDVFRGINENFARRNISILEFVDFFEAYNESLADFQKIKTQLALLAEQVNYVTAYPIYR